MFISSIKLRISFFTFIISIFLSVILYFYISGLTSDIYGGDVGDLVTAAVVGGVAHPPGYPLFTLLGFILSHILLNLEPVTNVGLVSAFAAIGSLFVFWNITKIFIQNKLIQVISIGALAFSYHFWLYSEIPEVFMLNIFMSLSLFYNILAFYKREKFKNLSLTFLFLGLGLSNHMTILMLVPLVVLLAINKRNAIFAFRKKLLLVPLLLVVGLLPYLYIPLAASRNPVVSWDDAKNLSNFINLVLRRDYGTFSAGIFPRPAFELRSFLLKNYFESITVSLTLPVILISLLGIFNIIRKERYLGLSLLGSIILMGPVFILYAAFPITNNFVLATVERFYLMSEVMIATLFPWGLLLLYTFFVKVFSKKIYAIILLSVFILIPILQFAKNYQRTNLSQLSIGNEFGTNFLRNLPNGSLLVAEGDTKSFNTWYVRFVKKIRPDIELVEIGNFAIRNDYFTPLFEKSKKEYKKDDLYAFFRTIEKISKTRPVFATTQIKLNNTDFVWLPRGIGYQLIERKNFPSIEDYRKMFPSDFADIDIPERAKLLPHERNLTTSDIPTYYADSFVKIGDVFFNEYADFSAAAKYYKYATVIDPEFSKGYAGKSRVESQYGNCSDADKDMKKAIDLYPIEKSYYYFWYFNAVNCYKDPKKIDVVSQYYKRIFNEDIKKAITKEVQK